MNYFPPLEPSNVPIVGYILTFIASIITGVVMGIKLQKRKEAHEVKLKEMDIQGKREDHERALEVADRNRKIQAAEHFTRQATPVLDWLYALEQFYSNYLNPHNLNNYVGPMAKEFKVTLENLGKRMNREDENDVTDLFHLYFADEPLDPEEEAQVQSISGLADTHGVLSHQWTELLTEAIAIGKQGQASTDPEHQESLHVAYEAKKEEIRLKTLELINIVRQEINVIKDGTLAIKQDLKLRL